MVCGYRLLVVRDRGSVSGAFAEHELAEAVAVARADSFSWALIGSMVGTTREAARQRYGRNANEASSDRAAPADTSTEARPARGRLAG